MNTSTQHTFHIPVMGLAYTVDTPIKVARFGIDSVVSIIQDKLLEQMRSFYCEKYSIDYTEIPQDDLDHRAKRITAYLDLMQSIVSIQMEILKNEAFENGNDIVKYFELLPENSSLKLAYKDMVETVGEAKVKKQDALRKMIVPGSIDVNVMTKLDKPNYNADKEELPVEFCDAMAALRGYANSSLSSSIVFSAGLNPRLYAYVESFPDFFPDENGYIKKKIILKVSDYRSALIQGKFLAKKGIWISEFRVESGLNCGGHAFPTEGKLLGPILQEFKENKIQLSKELFDISNQALIEKNAPAFAQMPELKLSVQGGIGTANEDQFLREFYQMNATGWGSPFLLVPEATNVDEKTLNELVQAKKEDYYLSFASPLGIPFNNFRKSGAEAQRLKRIENERPGSPCHFKHLVSNSEFTDDYICLASRDYQRRKIKELKSSDLSEENYKMEYDRVTEKDCLCTGLSNAVLLKNELTIPFNLKAVTICPGPNLAYFSKTLSLEQMVGHIYGKFNHLNLLNRPHMFVNELVMYIDYLKNELKKSQAVLDKGRVKYFNNFKNNLAEGINYYKTLIPNLKSDSKELKEQFLADINTALDALDDMLVPEPKVVISE